MLNNNYFAGNQYQQPYFQPTMQTKINNILYASEDEIKGYILQPNGQIWAIDREKPVFYIKTADNLGRSIVKKYGFTEIDDNEPKMPNPEYLTKQDLVGLNNDLEFLKKQYRTLEERLKQRGGNNERTRND